MKSDDAVDTLISLSEVCEERYERRVVLSEENELEQWHAVHPNCQYVTSSSLQLRKHAQKLQREEKRRRAKQPKDHTHIRFGEASDLSNDPDRPCRKMLGIDSDFTLDKLYFRSYDVASYDAPSWRFIVTKRGGGRYVERCHPKDLHQLYDLHGSHLGVISTAYAHGEFLDPGSIFDLNLSVVYNERKSYAKNAFLERCDALDQLAGSEKSFVASSPAKVVFTTSDLDSRGSSDLKEGSIVARNRCNMKNAKLKSKATTKKRKLLCHERVKFAKHLNKVEDSSVCFLPPIVEACVKHAGPSDITSPSPQAACIDYQEQLSHANHADSVYAPPAVRNKTAKPDDLKPLYLPRLSYGNCGTLVSKLRKWNFSCAHAKVLTQEDIALPSIYGSCVALSL